MRLLAVMCALTAAACGTAPVDGEQVFRAALDDGNTFSCSTCHALKEPDDLRRAGHAIGDATKRPSWKNGAAPTFLDAVNSCVTTFMGARPWVEADARYVALKQFLDARAPAGAAPALRYAHVAPPSVVTGGDRSRGEALFNVSCAVCHGVDGRGAPQGPNLAGAMLDGDHIARRVRVQSGRMPAWSRERLDDGELRDLVAFVSTAQVPDAGLYTPDAGDPGPGSGGACAKTHAKVGWYADLATYAHGVRGRATITDDCTVTLSDFHYDGNGIDVRLYGGIARDFVNGFPIGGQLYRPGQPYVNVTLPMRLPEGKTLDELDSVSVWCVAARHNFGDGVFRAP
ncbi:MAG: DM13 domain-containing protein [Myxococcaceae bacterium]|nr:DM13 domain-containing protein [Myxococcaceae bacterium]